MRSEAALALPLAALFVAFFVAPLCVLVGISLYAEPEMQTFSTQQYVTFFSDVFNVSILRSTLWLGVKATLLCLLFGYPLAWIAARARARWQSVLGSVVILPLLTTVVVRTFSWIVILGRQGIVNKLLLGLGLVHKPERLLFTVAGVIVLLDHV